MCRREQRSGETACASRDGMWLGDGRHSGDGTCLGTACGQGTAPPPRPSRAPTVTAGQVTCPWHPHRDTGPVMPPLSAPQPAPTQGHGVSPRCHPEDVQPLGSPEVSKPTSATAWPHPHGHIPAFGTSPPLGGCRVGGHRRAAPSALFGFALSGGFPPFFYRCKFPFCSITGEEQTKHPSRAGSARPEALTQLVSALMTAPAAAAGGRAAIRKTPGALRACRGRSFGAGLIKRVTGNIRGQRDESCLALLRAGQAAAARGDLCHPLPPRPSWGRGWPPRGQQE